jgi:excinuclease ABC subunit A
MHFLPDVYVPCDSCEGKRYNRETLEILYKGRNITEVLELTVEDAHACFSAVPSIARKLQTLLDVGLGYITLGQSATTLSGGEAQRVKLALELSKRDTGRTLYILDEPTTGLHFADIALLLQVLHQLRDAGNTIVVIEHNLDVIKTADWVIDMGPEGGAGGGEVVAAGTPEQVAAHAASHTGHYLRPLLEADGAADAPQHVSPPQDSMRQDRVTARD